MPEKIRVGIVGASRWAANAHLPALKSLPSSYEVKAVCTTRQETAAAAKEAFGVDLAFHDINEMVARPDIDLVAVVVRTPTHHELVMTALGAGKAVCCEWPLAANLEQAKEMATLARERRLGSLVGLQGRSDPAWMYARDLLAAGHIGEVMTVNMIMMNKDMPRAKSSAYMADRRNGANSLTIGAGQILDMLCYILGEFSQIQARAVTMTKAWTFPDGSTVSVDAPDTVTMAGVLQRGAEVAFQLAPVAHNPSGNRVEIYGSEGTLVLTGQSMGIGPWALQGSRGDAPLAEMPALDKYYLAPKDVFFLARNIAQNYARYADPNATPQGGAPSFEDAVVRHRLLDAIERSSIEGRAISLA